MNKIKYQKKYKLDKIQKNNIFLKIQQKKLNNILNTYYQGYLMKMN